MSIVFFVDLTSFHFGFFFIKISFGVKISHQKDHFPENYRVFLYLFDNGPGRPLPVFLKPDFAFDGYLVLLGFLALFFFLAGSDWLRPHYSFITIIPETRCLFMADIGAAVEKKKRQRDRERERERDSPLIFGVRSPLLGGGWQ